MVTATLGGLPTAGAAAPPPPSPPTPGTPSPSAYVSHAPIRINGNAEFTAANGVVQGDGSLGNPYVIRGWHIYAHGAPAIEVRNVNAAFVIERNFLDVRAVTVASAITIDNAGTAGSILNNAISTEARGVTVRLSETRIERNTFWDASGARTGRAVVLEATSSLVRNNTFVNFDLALSAGGAAPRLLENVVLGGIDGFSLYETTGARIERNQFATQDAASIFLDVSVNTLVSGNTFQGIGTAVRVKGGTVEITSNAIWDAASRAIALEPDASAVVTANSITGGGAGVEATRSAVTLLNNHFHSLIGVSVTLLDTTGAVTANTFERTGGGIALAGSSLVAVTGNALTNNVWGLSIPYTARDSIPLLSGNFVNGVNVDGTINPSERVFHWRSANILVQSQTRDNGFGGGLYGALAKEGTLVFYDVDTALIRNSTISHGLVGVYAVNSFNITVQESLLMDLRCGVVFDNVIGAVKDNNITIIIDPPATCGVTVSAGFVLVLRNEVSNVDVGVRFDGRAEGRVELNTFDHANLGIEVVGHVGMYADAVVVANNTLLSGRTGISAVAFNGTIEGNVILDHSRAAIQLSMESRVTVKANAIANNGEGVIDKTPCTTYGPGCGQATLVSNVIVNNEGDGIRIQGGATLRGNVVTGNGGNGAFLTGAVDVIASNTFSFNAKAGAQVGSDIDVSMRGNRFDSNGEDGLRIGGTVTIIGDVYVNHSAGAGIRFRGLLMQGLGLNVSANLDGIVITEPLPSPPPVPTIGIPRLGDGLFYQPDPLYLHLSILEGNRRFAIESTPQTEVNATYNFWGTATGPRVNVANQVGAFNNAVSPTVRFMPYFTDRAMTTPGPLPFL